MKHLCGALKSILVAIYLCHACIFNDKFEERMVRNLR